MMRISDQAASLISFSSSPQVKSKKLKVDAQKMLQKASPGQRIRIDNELVDISLANGG